MRSSGLLASICALLLPACGGDEPEAPPAAGDDVVEVLADTPVADDLSAPEDLAVPDVPPVDTGPGGPDVGDTTLPDLQCPTAIVTQPQDGHAYLGVLPLQLTVSDESGVAAVRLTHAASGALLVELEGPFGADGLVVAQADICPYGTGEVPFALEVVDTEGNTCQKPLEPVVVRCPKLQAAAQYAVPGGEPARHVAAGDVDGDGADDVLAATAVGVAIYRTLPDGRLRPPRVPGALQDPAHLVIPDDLDADGDMDLLVVASSADGEGYVLRVVLWDQECALDPDFDPGALSEPELAAMVHPVRCAPTWVVVESHPLPARPVASVYAELASDPYPEGGSSAAEDLALGLDSAKSALGLFVREEGTNSYGQESQASWCAHWPTRYDGLKSPLPPQEHEITTCFLQPPSGWTAASAPPVALAAGDVVADPLGAADLVVAHAGSPTLEIVAGTGDGELLAPVLLDLKGLGPLGTEAFTAVQLHDPDGDDRLDLRLAAPGAQALLLVPGAEPAALGAPPFDAAGLTATCVEGAPTALLGTAPTLIANAATDTVWALTEEGPHIVGALPAPVQLVHGQLTAPADKHAELVLRSATHPALAVIAGGANGLPRGALHLPTTIPAQDPAALDRCDAALQVAGEPELGTPAARRAPIAATVSPDGERVALVLAPSPVVGIDPPILHARVELHHPSEGLMETVHVAAAGYTCGGDGCAVLSAHDKGAVVALIADEVDGESGFDLILASETTPPVPTTDVLFRTGAGGFAALTSPPGGADLPPGGEWSALGLSTQGAPVAAAALHCNGPSDTTADIALLGVTTAEGGPRAVLEVWQGGPQPVQAISHVYGPASTPLAVRVETLGGDQDERPDVIVLAEEGVSVFSGADVFCGFVGPVAVVGVAPDPRSVGAGDLDGDGLAELVLGYGDGTVAVMGGIDGVAFAAPVVHEMLPGALEVADVEVVDLNADGAADVLALDAAGRRAVLLVGMSDGTLQPLALPLGPGVVDLMITDFEQDGCKDLVALSSVAKAATVHRSLSCEPTP